MSNPAKYIVTSAPPNPNGDLHVGHLAGPFLGADVLTRYLRQTGREVVHVGYADDFSCYVTRRAAELDRPAEAVAHLYGRRIEQTLALGDLAQDYFTHPLREPVHGEVVRRFFGELWEAGAFEVRDLPAYWCRGCVRYLYEAEVRGLCQFCDAPSDGVYCEECGRPQDPTGLRAARCTACGVSDPETRTLRRIVFPLEKYRRRLRDHYAGKRLRPRLRAYLDDLLSSPLPVTPISRVSTYGISVPLPGWEGNILDTWYSGIWGYLAATIAEAGAYGSPEAGLAAWSDQETSIVHFIGFDCSFSHAILWPALLMAHGGLALPDNVVTNEFYQLEGKKFSTSRGHAIWGGDLLRRVPADLVRFYLCLTGPEREQGNFAVKDFVRTVNEQVVGSLQAWIRTVFGQVRQEWSGKLPAIDLVTDDEFVKQVRELPVRLSSALEPGGFSVQQAAAELQSVIHALPRATAELSRAGSGDAERYPALLASHLEALATVAATVAPIMPAFGLALWSALRLPLADPLRPTIAWPKPGERLVAAGHVVEVDPPTLFQPVEW